ncbi:hypothetical protein F4821DRAFT_271364 [Hypoxylon rubiginosum]|uniref:Uncharacterized protein n=1 Tax=Hypoxylon rubiginosum TaxID=110542 RepID=A0ACC0CVF8_9PEZI|nr:hypothetical protein F4821DRAFT_271364 [Hypoxylon rubiginosum]
MATASPLIKFDVCIYKSDDISEDEFFNWATKVYSVKAGPLMKRYGIVKWTQTLQPTGFRGPMRHALKTDMGRPDWTVPDYDLVTTYWLRSLDDMQALTTDPVWAELEKDAATKSNLSIGHFVIGHEVVQFEGNVDGAGA